MRAGALALRATPSATCPRACTSPSSTRAWDGGARGGRSRCAPREDERLLVGPDNGLLMLAAERLGGVAEAVDIGALAGAPASPSRATFHGRDVFAPVAAALAAGVPLGALGEPLRGGHDLRRCTSAARRTATRGLVSARARTDIFGNLSLDAHAGAARRAAGSRTATRSGVRDRRAARTTRRSRDVRATCPRASCCSTRTRAGCSRWPSTAAPPPSCSAPRADDEVLVAPAMNARRDRAERRRSARRACTSGATGSTNQTRAGARGRRRARTARS